MAPPAEAKVSPQEPPKVEVCIEDRKVAEKNERNDVKRKETSSSSSASEEKKEEVVEKEAPVIRDNKIELKYKYREGESSRWHLKNIQMIVLTVMSTSLL